MIPITFQKRLFIYIFFGFIGAAIIGTLSHECGHYLLARYYGFKNARINYAYTFYNQNNLDTQLIDIYHANASAIQQHKPFAEEVKYEALQKQLDFEYLMITAGGPLETIMTGVIGLILLFVFRKKFYGKETLKFWQWLLIFLSLFWLRQIFNLVTGIILLIKRDLKMQGDEFRLAMMLNLNPWLIYIVTGIISVIVFFFVLFKFIPARQRFTFLTAGFSGGLIGALLWLVLLGPRIMP